MSEELVSTTELMQMKGLSRTAIVNKIHSGELKARMVGKTYVINRGDAEKLEKMSRSEAGQRGGTIKWAKARKVQELQEYALNQSQAKEANARLGELFREEDF